VLALVEDPAVDLVGQDDEIMLDRATAAICSRSSRVETPPVGLAGELMISSLVR
jgi:hypothetical protein